mmetsp:Transcript_56260/g.163068  ORF Transcript_56260/g.163068 Transcript_56260/m.163068 type:complete len:139 (+) Transcript_56260:61-477(+)
MTDGACIVGCCGRASKPPTEHLVPTKGGEGSYKRVVKYEYVGDGNGDFDKIDEPQEQSLRSRCLRGLISVALGVLLGLCIARFCEFVGGKVHSMRGSSGAKASGHAEHATDWHPSARIPDWHPKISGALPAWVKPRQL